MSSYVTFWVKNKDGAITRLCDFCRSSKLYQIAKEAGIDGTYDKPKGDKDIWSVNKWANNVSCDKLTKMLSIANEYIVNNKERINELQEKINLIKDMAHSTIEERLDAINDYEHYICEYKTNIEQLEAAAAQIAFLEEIKNSAWYGATETERNNVLWAGIDCNMKGANDEEE